VAEDGEELVLRALRLARRGLAPIVALAATARALVAGGRVDAPAQPGSREIAEAAEALRQAASAVRSREAAARESERAKDEFLAILSHELRNPLATLAAAAYLLRRSAQNGAAEEAAQTISRQVEHMTRLIEDLLDLNRIAKGKVTLSREPLELAQAVGKALEELRAAGRLAKHGVRAELAPAWVRADEARIAQITANLVGNAVKYTPEGGEIVVGVRRVRDAAVLSVRDSGIGMEPDLAARVFDLFVQGQAGKGGLGVGLALVKRLAELHGGSAAAASEGTGRGSQFTVSIPAIEVPAQ
jgi:signal transduction histidine kinase